MSLGASGCGAYGQIVELDPKRTQSTDYTFVIETINGDRHEAHVLYDSLERRYTTHCHTCQGGRA